MDKKTEQKFNKTVLEELLGRYELLIDGVELVGTHQSFVYKARRGLRNEYVRITCAIHRSYKEIVAELDMIQYLADNGLDVAMPLLSERGNLIEIYEFHNDIFYSVIFKEAKGLGIGKYPWSLNVPNRVGIMNGRMHNILEGFEPVNSSRRFQWYENTFITNASSFLPEGNEKVIDELKYLINELSLLPKSKDSYGLVHGDMVACNYNMTDDTITLFDFDEASYCWFVNDIAVNTFYDALGWRGIVNKEDVCESFKSYIKGYTSVRSIDDYWIAKLPLFLKLREIILYVAIHRSKDITKLDMWNENFLSGRKELIEQKVPFIDLDFTKLMHS